MVYNFDAPTNRRNTNSVKWDSRPGLSSDVTPLWVADMDFKAAPAILEALERRLGVGIFGYTYVPDEYYDAITRWFDHWHGWHIDREQVIYTSGVVPALSAIIKAMTQPGDKVLIQTPVYNCFFSSIRNNGCQALESQLVLRQGRYEIDYDDLEAKASDPKCRLMLLCNPHNPAGRVWTRAELSRIADICDRHGVLVVSDEIHCELVFDGHEYVPYATVAPGRWVACVSPSKAFNIAGLQIANIVSSDADLRAHIDRAINDNEVCDVNPFGVDALIAAYNDSRDWLDQLIPYLYGNYQLLCDIFRREVPELPVIELEGTYLAWVDCRLLDMPTEELEELLIDGCDVWINAGSIYGQAGEGFIRINLATQRARLDAALHRLTAYLRHMIDSKK